jgi:hypothetical protein
MEKESLIPFTIYYSLFTAFLLFTIHRFYFIVHRSYFIV